MKTLLTALMVAAGLIAAPAIADDKRSAQHGVVIIDHDDDHDRGHGYDRRDWKHERKHHKRHWKDRDDDVTYHIHKYYDRRPAEIHYYESERRPRRVVERDVYRYDPDDRVIVRPYRGDSSSLDLRYHIDF